MRPRAARRAAAQLQSLFDSSLTYSSNEMMTMGNNGIGNAMITPAIQVINYFLINYSASITIGNDTKEFT